MGSGPYWDLIAREVERLQSDGVDPHLLEDREAAKRSVERLQGGIQRLVKRSRDVDDELAAIIERELLQAEREKQAALKTLAELDTLIARQEQAAVNLKSLYDYCRAVEQRLDEFGFEDRRLALTGGWL